MNPIDYIKPKKVLSLSSNIEFEFAETVPPREYHFKLGKETEEMIAVLSAVKPGTSMRFRVSGLQARQDRERELHQIRDRLKVATKHAPGAWKIQRRQHDYYAYRYPEEEQNEGYYDPEEY